MLHQLGYSSGTGLPADRAGTGAGAAGVPIYILHCMGSVRGGYCDRTNIVIGLWKQDRMKIVLLSL